jgi:nucleotide-binding universal stress UspA family protein
VAQEVVRDSSAPVLLIHPHESGSRDNAAYAFKRVLVPLDGASLGEEAIDHAVEVAGDSDVEFLLLHVLPPIVFFGEPPSLVVPDDTGLYEAAVSYLHDVGNEIRARGFSVDSHTIRHAHTARAILETAETSRADLIAMETHGRKGLERVTMGSIADKVVRGARVPVLLHRPRVDVTTSGDAHAQHSHLVGR